MKLMSRTCLCEMYEFNFILNFFDFFYDVLNVFLKAGANTPCSPYSHSTQWPYEKSSPSG